MSKVFDHNPLAMVVSRVDDGRIEQVNPAFLKLFAALGMRSSGKLRSSSG
ncbi:MAG: PAS domain-containing protein [Desulfobacteraceae bacterium]|nr:MAG: PAS domain-containing protein [Desulfobacteraceae bacterium]